MSAVYSIQQFSDSTAALMALTPTQQEVAEQHSVFLKSAIKLSVYSCTALSHMDRGMDEGGMDG